MYITLVSITIAIIRNLKSIRSEIKDRGLNHLNILKINSDDDLF